MRQRKHERGKKRQLGQYMTPRPLAREIVSTLDLGGVKRILEPSCGTGSFLHALEKRLATAEAAPDARSCIDLVGVELDERFAEEARSVASRIQTTSRSAVRTTICTADFFRLWLEPSTLVQSGSPVLRPESFDLIIGNPPFGGTLERSLEDALDRSLGQRCGKKIKKETYAFFIVACVELLRPGGQLVFVCSDTLVTIPTMTGLRNFLMESGETDVRDVTGFSDETTYPTVVLSFRKGTRLGRVSRNSERIPEETVRKTPNLSWGITPEFYEMFSGPLLGEYFVASSGMTTGKNEYFVREADKSGRIQEPFFFELYDGPVSLRYELDRARLGRLPMRRQTQLRAAEARGDTERRLRVVSRSDPVPVQMPNTKYRPYNKANGRIVFSNPTHYIYWENEGEAVLTYKKTGNWYLRGVGGQPYFGREGITWQLVASRFIARYLPSGYILDSGAPCAFLRNGKERDELFFVLGWLLSVSANRVLKQVVNHTRNIQSKDFERMPYPWWVDMQDRRRVVDHVKAMIGEAERGRVWSAKATEVRVLDELFSFSIARRIGQPGQASDPRRPATGFESVRPGTAPLRLF